MNTDLFDWLAQSGANACEKIPTLVDSSASGAARVAAEEIARVVKANAEAGAPCVLGLTTGSTPITVYRELVRKHREEGLSFRPVIIFNLNEHYPCRREDAFSCRRFMQEHLFDHLDIDPENTHVADGGLSREQLPGHCAEYEAKIRAAGERPERKRVLVISPHPDDDVISMGGTSCAGSAGTSH